MDAHSLHEATGHASKLTVFNREAAVTFAHLHDIGDTLRAYQMDGGSAVLLRPRQNASNYVL